MAERPDIPVSGIVAVLLVLTSALIHQQGPLLSSRPGGILERGAVQVGNVQDVDARLWEDPFDAVYRHRRDQSKAMPKPASATDAAALAAHHRADAIAKQIAEAAGGPQAAKDPDGPPVGVLAVMVFGGPYPEDGEHRRRMRYATLSALKVSGYYPDDSDHVGFIELTENERWLKPDESPLPALVPYEWFAADRSVRPLPRRLLVLWLDELAFQEAPMSHLDAALCRTLGTPSGATARDACASKSHPRPGGLPLVVLGPAGSNSLEAMVKEIVKAPPRQPGELWPWLHSAAIYSPTTTTSAIGLTAIAGTPAASEPEAEAQLSRLFQSKAETALLRVAVPDTMVMLDLVRELGFRGVDLGPAPDERGCRKLDHVALISEWDTVYGRTLPEAFRRATLGATDTARAMAGRPVGCDHIHSYSYMRGLDGTLFRPPGSGDDAKKEKDDGKASAADDRRERPEGNGQIDYLRRLARRLTDEDRQRQHEGQGRIRAIGVLGSDVYDKLMILQAVRGDFPDAVLFTTDLDARLVHPGEFARTRNLVVASGYGLHLHHALQADIAPFRSTDQTATFLAARLAVARLARSSASQPAPDATDAAQASLREWKKSAQVFEIGRTGAIELSRATSRVGCKSIGDCQNPRPASTGYYVQHLRPGFAWKAPLAGLLGLALLLLSSWTVRSVTQRMLAALGRCLHRSRPLFVVSVILLVTVGAFGTYALIQALLREDAEPFALLEGVSVWPTQLIRLAALILAVQGLAHVCRRLGAVRLTLTERYFPTDAAALKRVRAHWMHVVSWRGLRRIFAGGRRPSGPSAPFDVTSAWQEHMFQSSRGARIVRVSLMTVLFMLLGIVLARGIFRPPNLPYRGAWTARLDESLFWPVVVLILAMLFAIVDEIRLCDKFSNGLARSSLTQWSPATRAAFREERDVPDEMLTPWIDVRLIADWTAVSAPLVYYPAMVIVLMLVSRSTLFDAWDMPIGLLLVFVISGLYTLACALTLRRVAERTRAGCVETLSDAIFGATGQPDAQSSPIERLKLLRQEVESIRRGAFLPFNQQPVVKAIFLAISSGAGLVVAQYLMTR